jgi:hypothetical protein
MKNNKLRWIAASISIACSVIQATAIISLQWIAWVFLMISVIMWTYISYTEKDKARFTQQVVFILLSFFAIYNWFKYK